MTEIAIREASASDMPVVADLRWHWSIVEHDGVPSVDLPTYREAMVDFLADGGASSHTCLVADRGGEVVGMAWLAVVRRPPTPQQLTRADGDLQTVYVVPELRGNGVGTRLVEAAIARADALGLRCLTVHAATGAADYYRRLGFDGDPLTLVRRPGPPAP